MSPVYYLGWIDGDKPKTSVMVGAQIDRSRLPHIVPPTALASLGEHSQSLVEFFRTFPQRHVAQLLHQMNVRVFHVRLVVGRPQGSRQRPRRRCDQHGRADQQQQVVVVQRRENIAWRTWGGVETAHPSIRYASFAEGSATRHIRNNASRLRTFFCVGGKKSRDEFEKRRTKDGCRLFGAEPGDAAHEVKTADPVRAVMPNVVEDDKRAIGPAAKMRRSSFNVSITA